MIISFIHKWNLSAASYRYRAHIPARELGMPLNALTADVLVFAKPQPEEVKEIKSLSSDQVAIVDVCDSWLHRIYYVEMLKSADVITCPTLEMKKILAKHGYQAHHIDDPYEFAQADPHCNGNNLLWFGHGFWIQDLNNVIDRVRKYPLRVVSNTENTIRWSIPTLLEELKRADIVIIPKYADYKSPNRAVEAIRRGCFVVAEPHPALNGIPGIWKGDLVEGIEWASNNTGRAKEWTREAQSFVSKYHSPSRISTAWKMICKEAWESTSAVATGIGMGGLTLIGAGSTR